MNNLPDFSSHNYQVERELGQNRTCGRVTYLATRSPISPETPQALALRGSRADFSGMVAVVIKQFNFAQAASSWSDYDAYEQEIRVLQQLNHPSIPCYLDSFATPTGFCMVQEYKQAPSLAEPYPWTPQEIKQIGCAILEVLIYLQSLNPPIIHQDIKPENILVDRWQNLKVYLVDFGLARNGGTVPEKSEVAASSAVKGTLGFMPPEKLFNRQLTAASDLYSLGATMICLLTNTKSTEIGNLVDGSFRINFKHLVPRVNRQFIRWLEKMTAPNPKHRFANAATALKALRPIDVVGLTTSRGMLVNSLQFSTGAAVVALATLGSLSLMDRAPILLRNEPALYETALHHHNIQQHHRHLTTSKNIHHRLLDNRQCTNCDLRGANLRGMKLAGANLAGANLRGANLRGADLAGANLQGAELGSAYLTGANLGNANLQGADLGNADLRGAYLGHAKLPDAYLEDAYLKEAYLGDAKLWRANLEGAHLEGAKLRRAQLGNADLSGADLRGADLKRANLRNADLKGADLRRAHLWGARLQGANLEDAYLRGADLEGAHIKGAILPNGHIHP
ncbi:MAG: pentapeptide repeat-containing protein [Hormoscilla sp. GM102CHS1]|nr:pentapeptide repeat-containing protein [Hormoscilla sp. GM102CHS1]